MGELSAEAILSRYRAAQRRRSPWESVWHDCYTYALPQRGTGFGAQFDPARRHAERLFDGTATDAVEQLSASLLSQLTPPWSQWFGLAPGYDVNPLDRVLISEELDRATETIQGHFDRSNFAVEIHQAFLDLTTIGSATLLFEEAPLGSLSAFRLTAVPMSEMHFEAGPDDQILGQFRSRSLPARTLRSLFPEAELPEEKKSACPDHDRQSLPIIEAVLPGDEGFIYTALLLDKPNNPTCLARGVLSASPFITFHQLSMAEGSCRGLRSIARHDRTSRHQDH